MINGKLDRKQVRALYEQHGRVLLAYALTLLPDRSASEDVLHQVFVKLLQGNVAIAGPPVHYLSPFGMRRTTTGAIIRARWSCRPTGTGSRARRR